jgi:hypothetical protein
MSTAGILEESSFLQTRGRRSFPGHWRSSSDWMSCRSGMSTWSSSHVPAALATNDLMRRVSRRGEPCSTHTAESLQVDPASGLEKGSRESLAGRRPLIANWDLRIQGNADSHRTAGARSRTSGIKTRTLFRCRDRTYIHHRCRLPRWQLTGQMVAMYSQYHISMWRFCM